MEKPLDHLTPPTIIIRHQKEKKKKCSIYPLKGKRPDILIKTFPLRKLPPLEGYVRLSPEGTPLTALDADCGLLLLDSSWRRVKNLLQGVDHLPVRSLPGFQTAFPRISHQGTDPDEGLASVEALYIAYQILGRSTIGLLDEYVWREKFLQINGFSESR